MSESVSNDTVRHIALLSRIELADDEIPAMAGKLSSVLEYFDKLQALDTTDVEPMTRAVELHNVLAPDKLGTSLTPNQALANAPQRDGDYFRVPKVIGESQ